MSGLLTNLCQRSGAGSLIRPLFGSLKILARHRCNEVIVLPQSIGHMTAVKTEDDPYLPGQLFIHRIFPYRGIIGCAFSCPIEDKCGFMRDDEPQLLTKQTNCYQVLIHTGDWKHMRFPADLTSYLEDVGGEHGEKSVSVILGLDCAPHQDIIPYETTDAQPLHHELFSTVFETTRDSHGWSRFGVKKNPGYLANHRSNQILNQITPHSVYRQTTDDVTVTVTTFYLGVNNENSLQKHLWRYVVRLENLGKCALIARAREMKVYSLTNMQQQKEAFLIGKKDFQYPRLSPENPAFQYSGMVSVAVDRGSYAWGNFTMEREEDRAAFIVRVPTFRLECNPNTPPEQSEEFS